MYRLFLSILIALGITGCSPKLAPDSGWGYQRWVLIELKEVPVQQSGGQRDAFVEFFPSEHRFSGNGGCNRINGTYTIDKRDRIKFSDISSTKMSCPDIAFENTIIESFGSIDRFETTDTRIILKDDRKRMLVFERRAIR